MTGIKRSRWAALTALVLGLLLMLTGCASPKLGERDDRTVNDYPGMTMTVVEGTAGPGSVTIEILNATDREMASGNEYDYAIQTEEDGEWYFLEEKSLDNTSEALIYQQDTSCRQELSWMRRYGQLPPGHYRIVKAFWDSDGEFSSTFRLAAEFTLN
ncbi:MAG: immunoglobulin-like domain-containing protein [Candidatus Onthomonas sp.]